METPNITGIPGYELYEYKIILNPHQDLSDRIVRLKEEFNQKLGIEQKYVSRPQLILATFTQVKALEEKICNKLHTVAMGLVPVKIELKDYGSLPSHTIHINVTSKLPVAYLVKSIREGVQKLMKYDADHKPHFIMDANIAIGLRLKPFQYEKAWLEYSHRHFTGKFIADHMWLLKRKVGEFKYTTVSIFKFEGMPIENTEARQGDLFSS